ncbi:transposase [Streptomyces sp. FXJ1.172]|nr:transposase [Streptomyces sp. FXJ1.172]WEO92655.1 transposase [Streptomyces sp. FXJ1.172]
MALSQSELIRLLESLRSTDGIELIRAIAERMVQELIEAEASAHIGAEWNEHTPTRTNIRNGHREKVLTTLAGDLDLEIPMASTWVADGKPWDGRAAATALQPTRASLVAGADVAIHTRPEGPHPFQDPSPETCITNLRGQNT